MSQSGLIPAVIVTAISLLLSPGYAGPGRAEADSAAKSGSTEPSRAAAAEEKEAMEIGGLLTLDGANPFKKWENTQADLSRVELSSIVHVAPNMEGSVTLMAADKPDSIVLYQAVGQWTLPQGRVIFGRQAFNASLLTTRIVSLPLMFELGEVRDDGVTLITTRKKLNFGFGLSSLPTGPDSNRTYNPIVILNADFTPEGQLARLAIQASRLRQVVDGAVNLSFGRILLDMEGMWRIQDDDDVAKGGFAAGLAYNFTEMFALAGRWDGLGDENNGVDHQRVAGCLTITFPEHVFGAGEVAWDEKDGMVFDLQMGLQSTLKLPGFQHKTLSK